MKAYKGFDKDLKCRGFQYEVGKEYETGWAKLCDAGFHACENPLHTLKYYNPTDGRYCQVELDATEETSGDDTKRVGKRIMIETEIGLKGLIEAGVKFVFDKCEGATEQAASGRSGNAAASGEYGNAAASGWYGNAAASGRYGNAAASGEYGNAAASGEYGNAAASGWYGNAAASGEYGNARTRDGVAAAIGFEGKAMGDEVGSYIVLSDWRFEDDGWKLYGVKARKVDGKHIKPGVWYTIKDGKVVEA